MFTTDYNTNLQIISDALRSEQSFDLVKRDLIIAERKAALFFIDGLLKDDITEKILEFFKFMLGRAFTMVVELIGFYLLFNILGIQKLISKTLITVIVIILNFFISKFFAFKK